MEQEHVHATHRKPLLSALSFVQLLRKVAVIVIELPVQQGCDRNLYKQAKQREPHEVATLAAQLAVENMPSEVQHLGFKLLEHLVGLSALISPA